MTFSTRVALGFVAGGFLVGLAMGFLDVRDSNPPVWVAIAVLCFVTVFVLRLRENFHQQGKGSTRKQKGQD